MKKDTAEKIVFVGVSGGVDSSVSAAILKDQGYKVVGVFIRTWAPDFIECTWRDERRDAMRVCAHLGIPFLECEAEEAYKKKVADYMIKEYQKGNTPNPDVMCNREIKFGIFWDFAKKHGADFIATGHYAINFKNSAPTPVVSDSYFLLKKGKDVSKDQSYFLWTLTQDDLSHIIFPVGGFNKIKVRELAKKYKIPVANKKDSQGVCFLGPLDMKDFLKHYIKTEKGDVLNTQGEIIGTHNGSLFFTLEERHGFKIFDKNKKKNNKPLYVIDKDIKNNTITVSARKVLAEGNTYVHKIIICKNINWISEVPKLTKQYTAQIRYHGKFLKCKVKTKEKSLEAEIIFKKPVLVDKGQSIVLYDGDICLGGGIVE